MTIATFFYNIDSLNVYCTFLPPRLLSSSGQHSIHMNVRKRKLFSFLRFGTKLGVLPLTWRRWTAFQRKFRNLFSKSKIFANNTTRIKHQQQVVCLAWIRLLLIRFVLAHAKVPVVL